MYAARQFLCFSGFFIGGNPILTCLDLRLNPRKPRARVVAQCIRVLALHLVWILTAAHLSAVS